MLSPLEMPIHGHFSRRTILTRKIGLTELVFLVCDQGSLTGLCKQDYKSLCAEVVTPGLTYPDTQTSTDSILTSLGLYE